MDNLLFALILITSSTASYADVFTRFPEDFSAEKQGRKGWYYCWSAWGTHGSEDENDLLEWIEGRDALYPEPGHDGDGYYVDGALIRSVDDGTVILSPFGETRKTPFLRWVSDKEAISYSIVGTFRRTQPDGGETGDGLVALIHVNGKEAFKVEIGTGDLDDHQFDVDMKSPLKVGDKIDFIVDGKDNPFFDNLAVEAEIAGKN